MIIIKSDKKKRTATEWHLLDTVSESSESNEGVGGSDGGGGGGGKGGGGIGGGVRDGGVLLIE